MEAPHFPLAFINHNMHLLFSTISAANIPPPFKYPPPTQILLPSDHQIVEQHTSLQSSSTSLSLSLESRKRSQSIRSRGANQMAISRVLTAFTVLVFAVSLLLPSIHADSIVSPAPTPTSDGTSIDQGIAYALMLVALALTYLIH